MPSRTPVAPIGRLVGLPMASPRAFLGGVLPLVLALSGCAAMSAAPSPQAKIGVDVGLRRGAAWTTFNVRPSRIVGSTASLELKKGQIVGFLDNKTVRLEVKPEELTGVAGGRVALDIDQQPGSMEISGLWNDNRVHFEITPDSLRGTITGGSLGHCQYVLDHTDGDGARSGTSICSWMPEETRLEFPSSVERWLGRGETVAVLLALLSSAPPTTADY
jgi:hypothetical protein